MAKVNDSLQTLLDEMSTEHPDANSKLSQQLSKAMELAKSIKSRSTGILSKFSLDGQVALVTGGGQGIGRAFAHALGEAGCSIAVCDIDLTRAESVSSELTLKGIPSVPIKVNVSIKSEVELMVQLCLEHFGDLHIACNNAGIVFQGPAEFTSEQDWSNLLGTNLNGVFFSCQAEAKHMLSKGYGRIINTASILGTIAPHPQKQAAHSTAKAGVVHLTKTLATEWADRGVTVNSISPGWIDTPLIQCEALEKPREVWIRDTPMGRLGKVEDLTGAVIYLASGLAGFTTGLDMVIDGGFTCW